MNHMQERATNKQRATSGARTGTPGLPFPGYLSTFEFHRWHRRALDEIDTDPKEVEPDSQVD